MTPRMRVGVDATSWVNRRGYGRFARNAVGRLIELDPDATYLLYVDEPSAPAVDVPAGAEAVVVPVGQPQAEAAAAGSSRSVRDLLRLGRAVRSSGLDAFLFPSVYTYFPVLGVPTVVGVHDLIADTLPELTFANRRTRRLWQLKERVAIRRARRLFTVSESSRRAISARLGVEPGGLTVVPEAPAPVFFPRGDDRTAAELKALGLGATEPFLLFAGGISPHKNLETLLDAFAAVRQSEAEPPRLVAVGDLESDSFLSAAAAVKERVADLGLEEHVVFPGYVADETLASLYSAATAVVIPSLAEGFGLPAVEAAACGAPTVLSDLPAHRETLGDAALYFPPTDREELTRLLGRVIRDVELRRNLGQRGKRAVAGLSWDASAERLRDLIREAAADGSGGS